MISTRSLYEACHELFDRYPQAVRAANSNGTVSLMVLLVDTGNAERFYVLSRDRREDRPRYWLRQWRTECVADIAPDGPSVPGVTADAVTRGVPIPQDEHLFGWKNRDHVSALIVFYTRYAPEHPEPVWAVMPLVSTTTPQWPPFAGESTLGHWFWDYYSAGSVVSVDGVVGANPDTVLLGEYASHPWLGLLRGGTRYRQPGRIYAATWPLRVPAGTRNEQTSADTGGTARRRRQSGPCPPLLSAITVGGMTNVERHSIGAVTAWPVMDVNGQPLV